MHDVILLGIESSCDETSVAILEENGTVRSNLIASQIAKHQPFGGVVPEIASREHLRNFRPTLDRAMSDAGVTLDEIDAIAVTVGPGLIGALLVGVAAAQGLAWGRGLPLIGINHLQGHIFSPFLLGDQPAIAAPSRFWSLVVSGGHSSVYGVRSNGTMELSTLNRTRDDAGGEIFDKVAKFIGLPYPGGPHVERWSREGDVAAYPFPKPRLKDESLDFSFSGLKSNAIRLARSLGIEGAAAGEPDEETRKKIADFCASFQMAICNHLIDRLDAMWQATPDDEKPEMVALGGGVAANGVLRGEMEAWGARTGVAVRLAERKFCTDNAAMIAWAGILLRDVCEVDPRRVPARSRMPF